MAALPAPPLAEAIAQLLPLVAERRGFPVVPVAYFRFDGELAPRQPTEVIAASPSAPLLLVDVGSGRLHPVVASTLAADGYVPSHVLAVAPRPGVVLAPRRIYAFVVMRAANDAAGKALGVPLAMVQLAGGATPAGARGPAMRALLAPLWPVLRKQGVNVAQVAAATVFTTGDVVEDNFQLTEALLARHAVTVSDLRLDPTDGASHERFCELHGQVTYPQFQSGAPPFNTGGRFVFDETGVPVQQREEIAPVVINLPRGPMPAGGWPLLVFFHGSGGLSTGVVDRGPVLVAGGPDQKGMGPAHVLAAYGIATAASALPVNPERLPGAGETAYLNLKNLSAFRDTFRQGVVEQRLFIEALRTLAIAPDALSDCAGPSLPGSETAFRFDPDKLLAQGQSMGGMYTNLIGAVEPRIRAVAPTGAGGYWSLFILETSLIPGAATLVALMLKTEAALSFLHPAMHLLQTAWEPADPIVAMPRLARMPLAGHPVRPIYEPVGKDDEYFPPPVYDAVALAYGNQQAGEVIWPSMQEALALEGHAGLQSYPVRQNRASASGAPYTGVVVQYLGDGLDDPHAIYKQLDAVKYQYGCFFSTFLQNGVAVVPAPAPLGTACPQ